MISIDSGIPTSKNTKTVEGYCLVKIDRRLIIMELCNVITILTDVILNTIIIDDKSRMCGSGPKTKAQLSVWKAQSSTKSKKVHKIQSKTKVWHF